MRTTVPRNVGCFICGQPFRLRPLRKTLKHCLEHKHKEKVWFTCAGKIAQHCMALPTYRDSDGKSSIQARSRSTIGNAVTFRRADNKAGSVCVDGHEGPAECLFLRHQLMLP
jgi:hypothetical protein